MPASPRTHSPVPSGRKSRLLHLGGLALGIAGGAVAEGARQLARGNVPTPGEVLLTPGNAARLRHHLSRLRGAAMKVGQLLSMEAEEVIPPELSAVLASLRSDAHAMPLDQLARTLRGAWGEGWEGRFSRFQTSALAAASIGQVHRAETRRGEPVAIKVQYPGVRDSIDSDVDNVLTLLRTMRLLPPDLDLGPLLDEAKRQLHEEADYGREADHLEQFAALVGSSPGLCLPTVHRELCTPTVLAMSYMEGEPIESLESAPQSVRDEAAARLLHLFFRELFDFALVQTDPNFANFLYQRDADRLVLLDFGATRSFGSERVRAYRALLRAGASGDRRGVAETARRIGYLGASDHPGHVDSVVSLILTACEPLRHEGAFDFARSDIAARLRETGLALGLEQGFRRMPPPDTAFLHRKAGGLFLLCVRLRARVDVRALAAPYLAGSGEAVAALGTLRQTA